MKELYYCFLINNYWLRTVNLTATLQGKAMVSDLTIYLNFIVGGAWLIIFPQHWISAQVKLLKLFKRNENASISDEEKPMFSTYQYV